LIPPESPGKVSCPQLVRLHAQDHDLAEGGISQQFVRNLDRDFHGSLGSMFISLSLDRFRLGIWQMTGPRPAGRPWTRADSREVDGRTGKIRALSGRFRAPGGCGKLPLEVFAMHDDDNPEIEYSPLCEEVTQDGLTVRVQIYRLKTGNNG
jgi:hypothetical protein